MRLFALALVVVVACKGREATPATLTEAEANTFATQLIPALSPCDEAKLAPLTDLATLAQTLCKWMRGADEVKLLRVRTVSGEPRPVLRRLARDIRTGAVIVGYDALRLHKTTEVRLADAYSYLQGEWVSEGELPEAAAEARDLQRQGKSAEALARIDALQKATRNERSVQLLRVRAAAGTGQPEYKQALAELSTIFPHDASIAMAQIDGAFAVQDWNAALEWIDVLDKAIGGDAVLDARRAVAYLRLGDLEHARAAADKATTTEPTLTHAWEVKLDVVIAQKKWSDAIAVLTELGDKHGISLDNANVAARPEVAELLASAEYKEWRAGRRR